MSVTTSKIITDNDTKNEEMRFLRYSPAFTHFIANKEMLQMVSSLHDHFRNPLPSHFSSSRRQELRELRLLQKEEQRAQQQLSNKLQQQKEQIYRRFEQETTVSHSGLRHVWAQMLPTKLLTTL